MQTLKTIQTDIEALPPHLQAEVLDFVAFVKNRHGYASAPPVLPTGSAGDSPFFQALTQCGFVGCIESSEQLATTYKTALDFADKSPGST
jgi:hypothetical protein